MHSVCMIEVIGLLFNSVMLLVFGDGSVGNHIFEEFRGKVAELALMPPRNFSMARNNRFTWPNLDTPSDLRASLSEIEEHFSGVS